MKTLRIYISKIRQDSEESGVTSGEYAIMLMLIALAVATFGTGISGSVVSVFSRMISVLSLAT